MKIRRVRTHLGLETQQHLDGGWEPIDASPLGPSPFNDEWQIEVADEHLRHTDSLLPFVPLSFRDFMLSERHCIDASRGLVRRFHPRTSIATTAFEKMTGRVFPAFRPRALFHDQPIYYFGNAMTIVPTGTPVSVPSYSRSLDFELELAFVLRTSLCNASLDEAYDAIGGFVLLNDFSARDVQRREMASGMGPQKSKHFLSSMSATAVTADEVFPNLEHLEGSVIINGVVVSRVTTRDLRWSVGEVLVHASRDEQLHPGELFATGTLPGGSGMEIGHWLRPHDELRLTLDGVGDIIHRIV